MREMFALAFALFAVAPALAEVRPFTVPSTADGFPLHGQTDLPNGSPRAVVVFFPGGGNYSRDLQFAVPGRQKSLVFRELAQRLNMAGIAALRYDERGISCVGKTPPDGPDDRCHDPSVLQQMNWDTLFGDADAIYRQAATGPGRHCVIVLGHSEGLLNLARLIDGNRAKPAGIIGVGGVLESPAGAIWWQFVESLPLSVGMSDLDGNGRVTEQEFKVNLERTPIRWAWNQIPWPPGFSWPATGIALTDIPKLRSGTLKVYWQQRMETISKPPTELLTRTDAGKVVPRGSAAWLQRYFLDWRPVATLLSRYDGPIHLFYGTRDAATEPTRQLTAARQFLGDAELFATVTPDVGHTLGAHPLYGPMREDQQQAIVAAAEQIAGRCNRRDK